LTGSKGFHRWVAPTLRELKRRKDAMLEHRVYPRSSYIEWNFDSEIYSFGKRLGEDFDKNLLKQALTEKSYISKEESKLRSVDIEPEINIEDNSTLVVEGEQFIEAYIIQYLKNIFPKLPHEYIRNIKDHLVSDESLSHVSKHIGVDDLALTEEYPPSKVSLSRIFKGVVAALLKSSGEDKAGNFVRDFVVTQLSGKDVTPFCSPSDPLKTLQEALKAEGQAEAEPRLIAEIGKNTILASYQVGIYSNKKLIGRGCGKTPWSAEDMAALDALWKRWGIFLSRKPIPFNLELPPLKRSSQQISLP